MHAQQPFNRGTEFEAQGNVKVAAAFGLHGTQGWSLSGLGVRVFFFLSERPVHSSFGIACSETHEQSQHSEKCARGAERLFWHLYFLVCCCV